MDILLLFYLDLTPIFPLAKFGIDFQPLFWLTQPIVVKVFDKCFIGQIMVIYNKNVPYPPHPSPRNRPKIYPP